MWYVLENVNLCVIQMPPRRGMNAEPTVLDLICQFNKLRPPKFQGGTDPIRYEEWKRKIENLFEILDCPAHHKVALTTYQFEGEAEYWWGTVKPAPGENPMPWEHLIELMDAKYYPRDVQRMKEREFLSLRQGTLTVMEYAACFNELSRFAPHQIDTEERKMNHFEHGLRGEIKAALAGQTFVTFQDLYQKAVKVARVLEEVEREKRVQPKKRQNFYRPSSSNRTKFFRSSASGDKGKQPMREPERPWCRNCGKPHSGRCLLGAIRCFNCGELGHRRQNCPRLAVSQPNSTPAPTQFQRQGPRPPMNPNRTNIRQRGKKNVSQKPQTSGRVFCLETGEAQNPNAVITGTFIVNTVPVEILFDAGATHSFINPAVVSRLACACEELTVQLCVSTPVGSSYCADLVVRDCKIEIEGRWFSADLILLGIQGYDVILGMDWLAKYQGKLDCDFKIVTLVTPEGEQVIYKGNVSRPSVPIISTVKTANW
jgi:hypothetical protein